MTEEIENSAEQEAAPLETEVNESIEATQEAPAEEAVKKADDAQERNWAAMRQRQKEMEWQLKQKDEMLANFLQMQKGQAPQPARGPEEAEIPDDDYPSAGGVKGIARKAVQPLEQKIQALEAKIAQQEQQKLVQSLRVQYPDFDDVVNVETLEILEKKEPELAQTIAELKDHYKMGIQSYKYIKALGLHTSLPESRRVKEVEKKLEKNAKSVASPMAYDKRPMAQAFKSTAADKKRLYEEMMSYASQATGL